MPAFLGHRKRLVMQSKPTRIEKQFLEVKKMNTGIKHILIQEGLWQTKYMML